MQASIRSMLGLGFVAIAASAPQAFVYNIVSNMYHNPAGYPIGSSVWAMTSAVAANPAMTYGPYATDIPAGENLVMTTVQATPGSGVSLGFTWDGIDQNRGQSLFGRTFSTSAFKSYVLANLVNMPSQGKWEFRVYHRGNGNLQQGSVYVLTESGNKDREYWPATDQAGFHQVGYKVTESEMWEAKVGGAGCNPTCGSKYLTYGPYTTLSKGTGTYVAAFNLSIDNVAPSTQKVATIDIVYRNADGSSSNAGGRDIFRGDFTSNGTMTAFALQFNNPNVNTRDWEFRVKWHAVGVLRQAKTITYKVF